jgi:hypothetical protein
VVRADELQDRGVGSLKLQVLTLLPLVAAIALYATHRRNRPLLVVRVLINLITNNPIANGRYGPPSSSLPSLRRSSTFGAARFRQWQPRVVRDHPHLALPSGLLRSTEARELEASGPSELVLNADYGMFQQELNGTEYVHEHGYTSGAQFASSVGVPVPRKLWPSKAPDTGDVVGADAGFNVSASLWTELFIDFGWGGLLAGFVGFGYLSASFDRWMREARGRAPLVIVPVLAAFTMTLLRGSLQPTMGILILLVLCFAYCLRPSKEVARGGPAPAAANSQPQAGPEGVSRPGPRLG